MKKKIGLILQLTFLLLCIYLYIMWVQIWIFILGCIAISIFSAIFKNNAVTSSRVAFYMAGAYSLIFSALIFVNMHLSFSSMLLLDKIYWICCFVILFSITILLICLVAFILAELKLKLLKF